MKSFAAAITLLVFLILSCKKNNTDVQPVTACWQLIDAFGNEVDSMCGKTEAQMLDAYPSCAFYKIEGQKYCWFSNGVLIRDKTETGIKHLQMCFGIGTVEKKDCNYCQDWFTREKRTYKPASITSYSTVRKTNFCGDTVLTLYNGREIIRKDDADSLIIVQFSNTGVF
jgi:hypothetical protein